MLHNAQRSKKSTKTAKIRQIVETRAWEELTKKDRFSAPLFTYGEIAPFVKRFTQAAEDAAKRARECPLEDRRPDTVFAQAYDEAYGAYEIVLALELRRQPTPLERAKIPLMIIPPDPRELARIDTLRTVEPEEGWPVVVTPHVDVDNEPDGISVNDRLPGRPR
jgi:hypothetical protein